MSKYRITYTASYVEEVFADELAETDLTIEQYAEYIWNDGEITPAKFVTKIEVI